MIKAVIFDLDGLLIDSEPIWYEAFKYLCQKHNIFPDKQVYDAAMGMGLKEVAILYKKKLGFKQSPEDMVREFREIFYQLFKEIRLMEGAPEFIQELNDKGLLLAAATGGHSAEKVREILMKFNLVDRFSAVVSSDDVEKGKPDPAVYIFTAEKLKVKPPECLVLEDAVNGVLAGKAAGMKVFGVNKVEKIREELRKAGADKVFARLSEIKEL